MLTLKSHLNGRWQAGEGPGVPLHNPVTEEIIATTSTRGLDLGAAVRFARDVGGPALRGMGFAERGALLNTLRKALQEAREDLLEASRISGGTPRGDAKFDVDGAIGTLAYYAHLSKSLGDRTYLVEGDGEKLTRAPRWSGYHIKVPLRGVAVHINAFNFPAWGMAEKAAVALLAGVPVITKPATSTALLSYRVMEVLVNTGALPEGAWQLVCGSAGDLVSHLGGQDTLAFTGSADTAAMLRGAANVVGRSVRVNVEADSLNAAILAPDVDDDTYQMFLRDVAREITQKTGQKCTATRRIFVPPADLDRVETDLSDRLSEIRVGDPAKEGVRMGPLATRQQLEDARSGIKRLLGAGARVVFGSATEVDVVTDTPGKGYFLGPMLLRADAPEEAVAVHAHEVFGPVATLMPSTSAEEAVHLVALGEGGLVASVYCDDRAYARTVVEGLAAHHGRVLLGSAKVVGQATAPGMVLPSCVHGGPGRAGGGEELGGLRGLDFYLQRCAVQGDRAILDHMFGLK